MWQLSLETRDIIQIAIDELSQPLPKIRIRNKQLVF